MPQTVKLHQVLAIEKGTQTETLRRLTLATRGMGTTGEQSPLSGLSRTYEARDDDPNNNISPLYGHRSVEPIKSQAPRAGIARGAAFCVGFCIASADPASNGGVKDHA